MSNLQFTTEDGGVQLDVETCRCETCKNFFWVPKAAIESHPTFCPFCGSRFETVSVDNLGAEMRSLFGAIEQAISPACLWIVGKALDVATSSWEFQGAFSSETAAERHCQDASYFIAPAFLDHAFPNHSVDWKGARYPKAP